MSKRPIRIRTSRYNREYGATVPTKKCPKKKRRRDLATNHNKQHHDESQASDDNAHNEAGTLDDRQVESSAHSSVNQEPSHQDSTPQHEEEYYHKNAFAMDKSHPEPIEDNDKHETIKDAEITLSIQQFLIRVKLNNLSNLNHTLQQVLTKQIHQKINMMM